MTNSHGEIHHRQAPTKLVVEDYDRGLRLVEPSITTNEEATRPAPARILLAEDDREFRSLVALRLRAAGFDVTEAADGAELMDSLVDPENPHERTDRFDLILSDINMPRITALNVLAGARSHIGRTPVVLITAFGDALTHERARQLGATVVIDKPFRLDDLCLSICRILSRPKAKLALVKSADKQD